MDRNSILIQLVMMSKGQRMRMERGSESYEKWGKKRFGMMRKRDDDVDQSCVDSFLMIVIGLNAVGIHDLDSLPLKLNGKEGKRRRRRGSPF